MKTMRNNTLYLAHHGIHGQKWGVRRYQNPDGTLTDEGKRRLRSIAKTSKKVAKISAPIAIVGMIKNPGVIYNGMKAIGAAFVGGTATASSGIGAFLASPITAIGAATILTGSLFAKQYAKNKLIEDRKLR